MSKSRTKAELEPKPEPQQSPIKIRTENLPASTLGTLQGRINYQPTPLRIIHNVHNVSFPYQLGSTLDLSEAGIYHLREFHFHVPGEHLINDDVHALEFHLVHQNVVDESLAVIAVFVDEREPGSGADPTPSERFVQRIAKNLPKEVGDKLTETFLSAEMILPPRLDYFDYQGSLTTFPFLTEKPVRWIVCKDPVTANRLDLKYLTDTLIHNARPCQIIQPGTIIAQYS